MIEVRPIGGYEEVGKNMTAIKIDDDVIILDMGLHLPNYIQYTEGEDADEVLKISAQALKRAGAIPDDSIIKSWRNKVRAIIPTHAHLDHVGAIPYLASKYYAPVVCTPFTAAVIRTILKDEKIKIENEIKVVNPNSTYRISKDLKIEFINMTHSTPQTVMVAIHTKYGVIIYANDFKLDNNPVLGKKPNYKALEAAGKKGVILAIIDSLYANHAIKTPSENIAREMLRDVLLGTDSRGKAVIISTFSSHIARLKSIVEFGKQMNRKIVFLGRSLAKYIYAAEDIALVNFSKQAEIVKYKRKIEKKLKEIEKKGVDKYLLIVTGHQGEPKATLSRMAHKVLPFHFHSEDHVIFSCKVIPSDINKKHRAELEKHLRQYGVRIFKDIHVSGHAAREDLRDFLKLIKPKKIIPAHCEIDRSEALADLGAEMGYKKGDSVILVNNGDTITLK